MIYLKTGQPGHGKTLRAIQQALEFRAKGREVYVAGVRGLKFADAGFQELADPRKWQDCPDGSVILLDECYQWFPKGGGTAKVPDYIQAMATHRHRGFDFILVCQQASKQLSPFILGLVEHHEHIRRKFGFKKALILWWDRYSDNVKKSDTKKFWSYPSTLMKRNLYESTTLDTTQRNVPWYVYALPLSVLFMLGLMGWTKGWFAEHSARPAASSPSNGGQPLLGGGVGGLAEKRPEDLVKWLTPRLPGQPWSAPAYDGRPVAAEPEVYCMAVDDGRCGCITEQGTKYEMEPAMCRTVARNGVYNPTRRPSPEGVRSRPRSEPAQAPSAPVQASGVDVAQGGLSARPRATAAVYTPPTYGAWNPDPWGGSSSHK